MSDAAPILLHRRHVYMLPTRPGYLFGCSALAMLLVATNYSNGLAFGFCFLLVSIAIVSMLYTQRNLQGVQISAITAEPVFAGDTARFPVVISALGSVARLGLWLEGDLSPGEFSVLSGQSVRRVIGRSAANRGRVSIPAVRLSSAYPMGIFFAWSRRAQFDRDCIVFPQPAAPLPFPDTTDHTSASGALAGRDGDDFQGLRAYQAGDSFRHIHWKTLPRTGALDVKTFSGMRQQERWFELSLAPGFGIETKLSQLCRWIIDAEQQNLRYGMRLGDDIAPLGHGSGHKIRCLTMLALYCSTDDGGVSE